MKRTVVHLSIITIRDLPRLTTAHGAASIPIPAISPDTNTTAIPVIKPLKE